MYWIILFLSVKCGFTHLIEVEEDGNATLQCRALRLTNLEATTIDVKRTDKNFSDSNRLLYSRQYGQDHPHPQSEHYRNRTWLNHRDLKAGSLTVVLSPVKPSDAGEYSANIVELSRSCFFTVRVNKTHRARPQTDGRREEGVHPEKGTKRPHVVLGVVFAAFVMTIVGLGIRSKKQGAQSKRSNPEQEVLTVEDGSAHVQLKVE